MTSKLKTLAPEFLLDNGIDYLLAKKLIERISAFYFRNIITFKEEKGKKVAVCCPRCLKAYLLKIAKENNLNKKIINKIKKIGCETGHYGYFMDSGDLVRCG